MRTRTARPPSTRSPPPSRRPRGAGLLCLAGLLGACASGGSGDLVLDTAPDASSPRSDAGAGTSVPEAGAESGGGGTMDAPSPAEDAGDDVVGEPDGEVGAVDASAEAAAEASVEAGVDAAHDGPSLESGPVDGGCTITSCGAQAVCAAGVCGVARRVFVSSAVYPATLGGHAGADATCQQLATAADLGGTWMAWISDSGSSPSARFTQASVPYALVTGTVVASGWSGLSSGTLAHGIDSDEHGQPVQGTTEVWTATGTDGTLYEDGCTSFTSSASSGTVEVGISGAADSTWTEVYEQFCSRTVHLYCIEQ